MKILDIDSPLMRGLSKMADLLWLNVLTIICCIPVITVGASLTALNYMALKIVRDEECYITKGYFKAFKDNFKQATIIWIIFVVAAFILVEDYFIASQFQGVYGDVLRVIIIVVAAAALFAFTFVFPTQAKFGNPVKLTMRNALFISILQFPKTILMIVMYAIPYVLMLVTAAVVPFVFMFGVSVPAFCSAKLYNGFFLKLEAQILENNPENGEEKAEEGEEPIFSDEIILSDNVENDQKEKK